MRRLSTGLLAGLTLLLAVGPLTGCRQGTFLGDRYNNFRAYYNTFYNARKAFEEGEEQLIRLDQQVDRSRYLSVFADVRMESAELGAASGSTSGPFQDAVDRSADLLRERPASKWADDALLLIGKAYFYQRNFVGAEAKFRETEAAAQERGQDALADEARFWLGRTLAAQERYDEAVTVLEGALDREGLSRYWRARLNLALAEQFVQQRAWGEAAAALTNGLADLRDADLAGRAYFLLGQVEEAQGNFEAAAAAYEAVEEHRPYYELAYAAQLNRALVLGLDAGRHDDAIALIRRMRRDDKHFQKRAEVELAYARLLAASGRSDEARERFEELLYGEEFRSAGVPRTDTYYHYGAFFRDVFNDYVRAAAYFDTASTTLPPQAGREALRTRAALAGVRDEAAAYSAYAGIADRLTEADSLLALGALDDDAFDARVAAIEAERRRAWEEEERRLARLRAQSGFADTPLSGGEGTGGLGQPPPEGGAPGGAADAGYLSYRDLARRTDALAAFQLVWGDRPLVPDWRRSQAIGGPLATEESDFGVQGSAPVGRSPGGPPPLDWTNVPRTPEARLVLLTERASLRYELGNVLFLSLARPDSAAYWYRRVIEENADEPVAARALYALAEVHRDQGRTAEAEPLYRRLLEGAPPADLAAQARQRLGLPPPEEEAAQDSTAHARAAYEAAYARWRAADYSTALDALLDLAVAFPETDQAPRALLAAAAVFTEWARGDSVDAEAGIPLELVAPELLTAAAEAAEVVVDAPADPEPPDDAPPLPGDEPAPDVVPAPDDEVVALRRMQDEGGGRQRAEDDVGREGQLRRPDVRPPDDDIDDVGVEEPLEVEEPFVAPPASGAAAAPDSLAGGPGAAEAAPADSTAADGTATDSTVTDSTRTTFGLLDLYRIVEARYPRTPYAEQARAARLAFLAAQAPPEEAPAEEPPAAAPVAVVLETAPEDAALPPEAVAAAPEAFGLEGEAPLDPRAGGYAWRVAAVPAPLAARALLRGYAESGLRAAAVLEQGEEGPEYALLIGQFASVADAEAARGRLPTTGVGEDLRVVALTGLALLDQDDLLRAAGVR